MQSSTALQTEPIQLRVPQNVIESRARARELHEQAVRQRTQELYEIQNQQPSTQLQKLTRKQQQYKNLITSGNIETAANQRLERIQNQTNQAQQITNAIKAIKTKNDAAVKIQSAVRNKSAFNQLEEAKTIKELKQKINRAFNNTKREIAAENTIKNAAKRKAINQLELRKGITKTQNRISELDTRTPNKMHLAFSKKGVVKVTPQVKAEEKQYLRQIEDQYKKHYTSLKEPGNTQASGAASSRLSTASTLGQQTPAKKK